MSTEADNLKEIVDGAWGSHIRFQLQCFDASAAYQYAKVLLAKAESTGEGYGERIAYMKLAIGKCALAVSTALGGDLPRNMSGTVEDLKRVVQKDLDKATTDNNSIYMDVVPQVWPL